MNSAKLPAMRQKESSSAERATPRGSMASVARRAEVE
jgi:hypothetical protein